MGGAYACATSLYTFSAIYILAHSIQCMGGEIAVICLIICLCALICLKLVLSHLERVDDARRETQLEKTRQYVRRDLAVAKAENGALDAFPVPEPAAGDGGLDGLISSVLSNPAILSQLGNLLGNGRKTDSSAAGGVASFRPETSAGTSTK